MKNNRFKKGNRVRHISSKKCYMVTEVFNFKNEQYIIGDNPLEFSPVLSDEFELYTEEEKDVTELRSKILDITQSLYPSIEVKDQPRVDFKMLNEMINFTGVTPEMRDNLQLFLEKMSQSSTFAHKAHKELQKLNN